MIKANDYIGTHLVMDITSYDRSSMRDEGKVSTYLSDLIRLADMTCLVHPQVFKFPYDNEYKRFLEKLEEEGTTSPLIKERLAILEENKNGNSGVTGIAVLAESHAAIHTFPEKDDPFMSVCLYSCKWYDADEIINHTNEFWDVKENHYVVMNRYLGRPQEINRGSITLGKKNKILSLVR